MAQIRASSLTNLRGRAYKSLHCQGPNSCIGEKRRVESHVYKIHIPLERSPFYCVPSDALHRKTLRNTSKTLGHIVLEKRSTGNNIKILSLTFLSFSWYHLIHITLMPQICIVFLWKRVNKCDKRGDVRFVVQQQQLLQRTQLN